MLRCITNAVNNLTFREHFGLKVRSMIFIDVVEMLKQSKFLYSCLSLFVRKQAIALDQ